MRKSATESVRESGKSECKIKSSKWRVCLECEVDHLRVGEEGAESEEEEELEEVVVVKYVKYGVEEEESMLRFFSRRKGKGRQEQKGVPGQRFPTKNKHVLPCNIILLDEGDLSLEVSVSVQEN